MHNTMINHGKLGLPNLETLDMLSRLSSLHWSSLILAVDHLWTFGRVMRLLHVAPRSIFDSSKYRHKPIEFQLGVGKVIPGSHGCRRDDHGWPAWVSKSPNIQSFLCKRCEHAPFSPCNSSFSQITPSKMQNITGFSVCTQAILLNCGRCETFDDES